MKILNTNIYSPENDQMEPFLRAEAESLARLEHESILQIGTELKEMHIQQPVWNPPSQIIEADGPNEIVISSQPFLQAMARDVHQQEAKAKRIMLDELLQNVQQEVEKRWKSHGIKTQLKVRCEATFVDEAIVSEITDDLIQALENMGHYRNVMATAGKSLNHQAHPIDLASETLKKADTPNWDEDDTDIFDDEKGDETFEDDDEEWLFQSPALQDPSCIHLVCRSSENLITFSLLELGSGLDIARLKADMLEPLSSRKGAVDLLFSKNLDGLNLKRRLWPESPWNQHSFTEKIARLNGCVRMDLQSGEGCAVEIAVPQSSFRMGALLVEAGKEKFAIPYAMVIDTSAVSLSEISLQENGEMVWEREDALIPLFPHPMSQYQISGALSQGITEDLPVVILGEEDRLYGMIVDDICGFEVLYTEPFLSESVWRGQETCGAGLTAKGHIVLVFHPKRWMDTLQTPHLLLPVENEDSSVFASI